MRIISKFHDYYDSIRAYGFDPRIVYDRKTEKLKLSLDEEELLIKPRFSHRDSIRIEHTTVSFCGEIHRGFKLAESIYTSPFLTDYGYIWSLDKLYRVYPKITEYFSSYNYDHSLNDAQLKKYFEMKPGSADLHIKYKTPVIAYRFDGPNSIIFEKDSRLTDLDFQQIYDPFTAFQKLAVFVGNVLTKQEKDPLPIPDKLKAQSKGFDDYSFKKRPT